MDIYKIAEKELKKEDIDSWRSDLYLKVTLKSKKIIDKYIEEGHTVKKFKSKIDNCHWYEIPFAYNPWWEERLNQKKSI